MKTVRIMLEDENEFLEDTPDHEIDTAIREVIKEFLEDFYVVEIEIDRDWGSSPYNSNENN
jgi:hypothetical protein